MTILLEHDPLPLTGPIELDLHRAFEINVTAEQAQRKVHLWLFTEVGNMLRADTPMLAVGERVVWRVPVVLTATSVGAVGVVGEIDVDVQDGAMNSSMEKAQSIQAQAVKLGNRLLPYKPRKTPLQRYQAKSAPSTYANLSTNPETIQQISAALTSD